MYRKFLGMWLGIESHGETLKKKKKSQIQRQLCSTNIVGIGISMVFLVLCTTFFFFLMSGAPKFHILRYLDSMLMLH